MNWDEAADRLLLNLWNEGGSLEFVADKMRLAGYTVSRNAVSGRKHRLQQWRDAGLVRPPNSYAVHSVNPNKTRPRALHIQRSKRLTEDDRNDKPPDKPVRKPLTTIDEMQAYMREHEGVDYLENPNWGCKAVMDGRFGCWGITKLCGKMRIDGSPYCRVHARLYTNSNTEPRIRRSHHG